MLPYEEFHKHLMSTRVRYLQTRSKKNKWKKDRRK